MEMFQQVLGGWRMVNGKEIYYESNDVRAALMEDPQPLWSKRTIALEMVCSCEA
jgi:hypothetical protein